MGRWMRTWQFTIWKGVCVLLLGVAIAAIVVGSSGMTGASIGEHGFGLAVVAVAALVLLDLAIPYSAGVNRVWYRSLIPFWCLFPFVALSLGAAWQHDQKRTAALDQIEQLATDIKVAVAAEQYISPPITAETITSVVVKLGDARFGKATAEGQRFIEIARVIGNDLIADGWDPAKVRAGAKDATFAGFLLALLAQGLFVFWIPVLLAVAVAKARKAVDKQWFEHANEESTSDGVRKSLSTRDKEILGERRSFLIPRLCFGVLLVLGTNYVFAPLGLKTTYLMTLADEHGLAGETSFTLWTTSFSQSPVIVAGFVGFLLYALITASQRFAQDDFDDRAMFSLLVRGLVVILLSFALSGSPIDGAVSRLFVFFAGVFPVRALEAIGKRFSVALDPDFPGDSTNNFDGVPNLDPTKVFALRAAGIQSLYDLVAMDINKVAEIVRIDPRLLGRTFDRAILIESVGKDLANKLEPFGVRHATELASLENQIPKAMADALGETANLLATRLADDPRVTSVRIWLAKTSPNVDLHAMSTAVLAEKLQRVMASDPADQPAAIAMVKEELVTIDLTPFGLDKLPLLSSTIRNFGELTDIVATRLAGKVGRFEYGRTWELRTDKADPTTAIPHQRQKAGIWGVAVADLTPLVDRGIKVGTTLFACPP